MNWMPVSPGYERYLTDESRLTGRAEWICFPETPEQAAQAFREAQGESLTIQGACTGLRGGAVPMGGRIINLSRLNHLDKIRETPAGGLVTAEAGVTLSQLQQQAGKHGLRLLPNPTEETATLGGLLALDSAGPNILAFGRISSYVTAITYVDENGNLREASRREPEFSEVISRKSMILRLELELKKQPQDLWGIVFFFPEEENALAFGKALNTFRENEKQAVLTTAEFYNAGVLELLRRFSQNPLLSKLPDIPANARCAVYAELEGESQDGSAQALMTLLDGFEASGGVDSWAENGPESVRRLRDLRHAIPSILSELSLPEWDWQGPPEKFSEFLQSYEKILRDSSPILYGHLLSNSFAIALEDPKILGEIHRFVMENGGSAGGQYGRGKVRKPWEELEKL